MMKKNLLLAILFGSTIIKFNYLWNLKELAEALTLTGHTFKNNILLGTVINNVTTTEVILMKIKNSRSNTY